MDYQKTLDTIKNKIGDKFPTVINDIEICIMAGSTGGEITSMVGKYLKDLEKTNLRAYSLIRNEIEDYIVECKKEGLIIR
ncbi:hypothetical protein [Flavobacterium sp.]|uniref:hypothetical protein n=1 Tax=Flavobacterium sp. TaxID=239 RepID=UPI00286E23DA|nr:hypothetical protein [Flavobacterium sp.]